MNLTCPGCGYHGDFVAFSNDAEARRFAGLMGQVPAELADSLLRYLNLFAPAKHRLAWPRARRLLDELVVAIKAGAIERKRRQWTVSNATWLQGFAELADKRAALTLPLKSHGYLYEVLVGIVEKTESKAEAHMELQRQAGTQRVGLNTHNLVDADEQRRQQLTRAFTEAVAEIQASKRLGSPEPTHEQLKTLLLRRGMAPDVVAEALDRLKKINDAGAPATSPTAVQT